MRRREDISPRPNWEQEVEQEGLAYRLTTLPSGKQVSYWRETVCYEMTDAELAVITRAGERLFQMFIQAGDYVIRHKLFAKLGIPEWAVPAIIELWKDPDDPESPARHDWYTMMMYGRYDLCPVLNSDRQIIGAKLYEYNADTPTGIVETMLTQWNWMVEHGFLSATTSQFNNLYEALVDGWADEITKFRDYTGRPVRLVHFVYSQQEESGEDLLNTEAMADAARAASEKLTASGKPGFEVKVIGAGDITKNTTERDGRQFGKPFFVDREGKRLDVVFKLYPWEWVLQNEDGRDIVENMLLLSGIVWVEPIWKMLWSNKGILAVLWEMFGNTPDADLLIPAYFEGEEPEGFAADCIRKPIHGREGGNAVLTVGGQIIERGPESHYDGDSPMGEPAVLQQYYPLPSFPSYLDGDSSTGQETDYHPVFGLWTVQTGVVALLIRESPNLVTNNLSYAVPHLITDISPDAEQGE
ncbi:MAG TPA: glutathionylspermidine synthase family protein [Candidatus Saccharimonadia bacterium]|nr:glutathionylspermidine synthase family protein [Candidatus Saccharimonadia bacterium]